MIHKGIHRAAAVGLGALEGGNTELLQQEQELIAGEGDRLFGGERRKLIGKRILLLLRDGRKISIDCTGVEDALDVTMAQRSELDYLIYNDPLGYADLILNGDPEEYLKNVVGSYGLEF